MAAASSIDLERDPRSIIGVREFDAPRDLVFSVWTDPKHLAQWWGPNGFTTTTHSFEMRPGGVFVVVDRIGKIEGSCHDTFSLSSPRTCHDCG